MVKSMFEDLTGNQSQYDVANVAPLAESPLCGKRILYLGSSVTLGFASQRQSFADFIAACHGNMFVKEAVNGTTLTDDSADSYVSRLHGVEVRQIFDLFVCQLSTNDCIKQKPLGNVDDVTPTTICGAINHIVDYVRRTWNCPIVFYTNPRYDSVGYRRMVDALLKIAARHNFDVINLFDNAAFNDITAEERALYMADDIHPTKAGYLLWWLPEFESALCNAICKKNFRCIL